MPVPAECHTDDYVVEATFDAEQWFSQASDEEIVDLASCGWGGDYAADRVAEFIAGFHEQVSSVFIYLRIVAYKKDRPGYECFIDPAAAMTWIGEHRPHLLSRVQSTIE
ncbi:MAG TPA: hypothetical protein VFK06_17870 [Candidatus Angelobacter sp.]|nr:hypothetical protein [Candidatus Angelobacter sp.]